MFATRKKVFMLVSWEENFHRDLLVGETSPPFDNKERRKNKNKKK